MMTRRMTEMRILDWGQMVSSQWPGSSQYSQELTQVTPQSRAPAAAAVSGMVRGCEAVERKVRMLCDTQGSSLVITAASPEPDPSGLRLTRTWPRLHGATAVSFSWWLEFPGSSGSRSRRDCWGAGAGPGRGWRGCR